MHRAFVTVVCPAFLLAVSCSGGASQSGPSAGSPKTPDTGHSRADAGPARGPADPPEEPARSASLSTAECQAMFDHSMDIAVAEHARSVVPDEVPTAEQVARIRADLQPGFMASCLASDRAIHGCVLKAHTVAELTVCFASQTPVPRSSQTPAPRSSQTPAPRSSQTPP